MDCYQFEAGCAKQGVNFYVPFERYSSLLYLSSRFADRLREGLPVTSGRIAIEGFCDGSTFFRQHAEIANSKLNPDAGQTLAFKEGFKTTGHCSDAEPHYGKWLDGLEYGRLVGGRILIDNENSPIAIQKSVKLGRFGEPSSLLLKDVAINGVEIPAGSIVYMRKKLDLLSRRGPFSGEPTRLMRMGQVLGMSFLRLSGFAMTDSEWKTFLPRTTRTKTMYLENAREIVSEFVKSSIESSLSAKVRRLTDFSSLKGADVVKSV